MTDGIQDLSVLHEVPYSNIDGAYVKVAIEKTGPKLTDPERWTEEREGTIVGRGNGQGVYYDTDAQEVLTHSIGPAIYLNTREETVLEVRTDKLGNELVEFRPEEA
jgi:hypothetical protein